MSFFSGKFLIFLAAAFAVYFAAYRFAPGVQWAVLLVSGIIFYGVASPKYFLFLAFSVLTTWGFGMLCGRIPSGSGKKRLLALVIVLNTGVLFALKYLFPLLVGPVILPLGISFYTFQSLSYCMDVYRRKIIPERNLLKYALFVSWFPQISEGPIGRYGELAPQLFAPNGFCYDNFTQGLSRAVTGAFKKLFVANTLATFVDAVYAKSATMSGALLSLAAIFYTFQIYADFSGYIDMALGISQCFGVTLRENFHAPDFAVSVNDFWKRWHISLTSWFREYLYIPLGGNRKGKMRTRINKMIVFLVSGLWHGADLSFALWGVLHGIYVVAGEMLQPVRDALVRRLKIRRESRLHRLFCTVRTFVLVTLAWILFRAENMAQAAEIFRRVFCHFYYDGWTGGIFAEFDIHYFITVLIGLLILFIIEFSEQKAPFSVCLAEKKMPVRWGMLYVMMLCLAYVIIFSDVKPADAANFIYFQF